MNMYEQGQMDVLTQLGLVKTAGGVGWWAQKAVPTLGRWGKGLKEFAVGSPGQFGREIMSGRAFKPNSLIRQSMAAPKLWEKALFYGLPAYEAGSIAFDKEPDKARRIGESVGGAVAGLATWKPLGMVGSMLAMPVGQRIGKTIGSMVGGRPAAPQQPPAQPGQPQQQYSGYQMSPAQFATGVARPVTSYMMGGGGQ